MQKITLNTTDGKIDLLAASKWSELTLKQLIEIESTYKDDLSVLRAFSILTGLSLKITESLKDKNIEKKVNQVVSFLQVAPDWNNLSKPDVIFIDGKAYKIPKKIGSLMIGQKVMLEQLLKKDNDVIKVIPKLISIIMQPYIDRKINENKLMYDHERVDNIELKVLKTDALSSYAIATFFFQKLINIINFGMIDLKKYQQQKNQTKRLQRNWLKLIDLTDTHHSVQLTT